jgi:hypothetical protein
MDRQLWETGGWLHDSARQRLLRETEDGWVGNLLEHDLHSIEFEMTEDGQRFRVIVEHIGVGDE